MSEARRLPDFKAASKILSMMNQSQTKQEEEELDGMAENAVYYEEEANRKVILSYGLEIDFQSLCTG